VARIYISSTYSDLREYREGVRAALRELRHDVVAMEDYVAADQRPLDKCLADVAASSIYLGIFAHRYGYIPEQDNPDGRSITELEYRHAAALGVPRLVFLLDDETPWPRGQMDDVTGEGDRGARIRGLREEMRHDLLASFFSTVDELARKASVAVSVMLQELDTGGGAADQPVVGGARPAPFNVPSDIPDLVDRSEALATLTALFDEDPEAEAPVVVSLYGPGGVGKSTLAIRLVRRLRERFPDGVLYALLTERSPEGVQTSTTLGDFLFLLGKTAQPASETRLVSEFRTTIADMRVLIFLDGVTTADQARPLLPVSKGSGAILTSRLPLSSLAGAELMPVPVLSDQDSIKLLVRLARITLDPSGTDEAARLARMCGNLPLAIRIAGAKLKIRPDWDLSTLVERMADEASRLDFLKIGDQEVRTTLVTSYADQDPSEQRALRALAITEGTEFPGWTLGPMLQISVAESERLIDRLVSAQLVFVSRDEGVAETLYRLHDLVRVLAKEKLEEIEPAHERTAIGLRLSIQYLELVERAAAALRELGSGATLTNGPARHAGSTGLANFQRVRALIDQHPTQWFADNREGIITSLRRISASGDELELMGRFAQSMLDLLILTPFSQDRFQVHQLLVEASRAAGDQARLAAALRDLARAYRDFGRYPESKKAFEEAIALFETLHDEESLVRARQLYAVLLLLVGRADDAREMTVRCLAYFETADDVVWQAYAHRTLELIYRDQAKWAESASHFEQALALFTRIRDRHREAICMVHFGAAIRMQGDPERALSMYERPAEVFSALGFDLWEAITQVHRAASLVDLGRYDDARSLLESSLATFTRIGDLRWVDIAEYHHGRLELRAGNLDAALPLLEQSAERISQLGELYSEARVLLTLGDAWLAHDRPRDAEGAFRRALTDASLIGNAMLEEAARRRLESLG
jgi:tetratricopeptide (TPR) repeat protein